MPTIKNKTKQVLCLTSADAEVVAIESGKSKSISEEMWANNENQACISVLLEQRQILVIHDGGVPEQASSSSPPPSSGDDEGGWAAMHWKTAQKLINTETNTDNLYKLLQTEERPKIKDMIEARIEELEAA